MLADEHVSPEVKARLAQEYLTLNPLALLRKLHRLQAALWTLALSEAAVPAIMQTVL
ncbi:MAG TPA: hypothetical protein VKU38_14985 [Ktedonobacteraceae bacterium]|nr:hypothetical protein [Ktedonobacteraceae bacterium]